MVAYDTASLNAWRRVMICIHHCRTILRAESDHRYHRIDNRYWNVLWIHPVFQHAPGHFANVLSMGFHLTGKPVTGVARETNGVISCDRKCKIRLAKLRY